MTSESKKKSVDLDKTDELPILSEEAVFGAPADGDLDSEATGEHKTIVIEALPDAERQLTEQARHNQDSAALQVLQQHINDLTTRWSGIEELLTTNSGAISTLQAELESARSELRRNQAKQEKTLHALADGKSRLAESELRAERAETRASELDRRVEAALARAAEADRRADEAIALTAEADRRADEAIARTAEADQRADEAVTGVAEAGQRADEAIARATEAEQRAEAALARAAEAEQRAADLQMVAEQAAVRASAAESQAEDAVSRADQYAEELRKAQELVGTAEKRADAAQARFADLEQGQSKQVAGADRHQAELLKYREQVTALESYVAGRSDRWLEMEDRVTTMTDRIAELEAELSQRVSRSERLEEQLQAEQGLSAEERQKAVELAGRLAERDRSLADLSRDLERFSAEQQKVDSDPLILSLQDEIVELRNTLESRELELATSIEERKGFESLLDAARLELEQTRTDFSRLEAKLESALDKTFDDVERSESPPILVDTADSGVTRLHSPLSPAAIRSAVLVCLTSDNPERHLLDKAQVTIGRSPQCDIQIKTHFVSREHAAVLCDDDLVEIEDRGSTNGIYVNGVKVQRAQLDHGDCVTIGETQFRFLQN